MERCAMNENRDGIEMGTVIHCTVEQLLNAMWDHVTGHGDDPVATIMEIKVRCAGGRVVVFRDDETVEVHGG
jgi:hypothetical protein